MTFKLLRDNIFYDTNLLKIYKIYSIICIKNKRRVFLVCKASNVLLLINAIHFSSTLFYVMCLLEPYLCNSFLARIFFLTKQRTKEKKMLAIIYGKSCHSKIGAVRRLMEDGHRAAALFNSSSSIIHIF